MATYSYADSPKPLGISLNCLIYNFQGVEIYEQLDTMQRKRIFVKKFRLIRSTIADC